MVENRKKKHRQKSHPIIHCPTSEGVSEVSEGVSEVSERANEWAQRRARAKRAVGSKRMNERSERTDERVAQYSNLYSWLFSTIMHRWLWGLFRVHGFLADSVFGTSILGFIRHRDSCRIREFLWYSFFSLLIFHFGQTTTTTASTFQNQWPLINDPLSFSLTDALLMAVRIGCVYKQKCRWS